MPHKDFDAAAGKYSVAQSSNEKSREHHLYVKGEVHLGRSYVENVLRPLELEPGRYLDIAGGAGEVAHALKKLFGGEVLVTDLSDAGLQVSLNEPGKNVVAEATKQPFADETFDFVHSKNG